MTEKPHSRMFHLEPWQAGHELAKSLLPPDMARSNRPLGIESVRPPAALRKDDAARKGGLSARKGRHVRTMCYNSTSTHADRMGAGATPGPQARDQGGSFHRGPEDHQSLRPLHPWRDASPRVSRPPRRARRLDRRCRRAAAALAERLRARRHRRRQRPTPRERTPRLRFAQGQDQRLSRARKVQGQATGRPRHPREPRAQSPPRGRRAPVRGRGLPGLRGRSPFARRRHAGERGCGAGAASQDEPGRRRRGAGRRGVVPRGAIRSRAARSERSAIASAA